MAADKIKIEVEVDAKDATRDLKKVDEAVSKVEGSTGKATIAQRAWKAANADLGQVTAGWREVGAQVAAVGAAFAALGAASVAVMANAEREENAIRRLGDAYGAISSATNGAMSAQQALTLQGQLQAAGVRANGQELAALTRLVREYSQATGNDMSEAIEKVTNAIVNNSEDALSELNLTLARSTTSTQTLANMTQMLEERFRNVAPAARTLNEDLQKIPGVITYIGNVAAQAAAGGLRSFIDMLHGAGSAASYWRDIVNFADDRRNIEQQGRSQDAMNRRSALREQILNRAQNVGARVSTDDLQGMNERQLSSLNSRLATGFGLEDRQGARTGDINAAFRQITGTTGTGVQLTVNPQQAFDSMLSAARRVVEQKIEPSVAANVRALDRDKIKLNEHAVAVQRSSESLSDFKDRLNRLKDESVDSILNYYRGDEFRRQNAFEVDADRAQSSLAAALGINATDGADFGAISDSVDGGGSAARAERSRRSRIANRDRETRRRAANESAAGRFGALLGVERDDNGNIKPLDGLQTGLNFAQQALPQLVSGFGELWTSIANGSMTAGEAFAAFGAKALSTLGNVAIQEGSAMLFKAIPALIEAPPLGAAYLAGGAGLIALGVGLGAAGAAAAPKPSTASANSDSNAARGMRSASLTSGKSGGLGSTTVVLSSLVPTGVVDAVNARNSLRQVGRSGLDDGQRIPRRVEH